MNDDSLKAGGLDWMRRAFAAYADGDHAVVPAFMTFALEALAKAFLYSRNPALLVELRGDLESLLHLAGESEHAKRKRPRTVGASEALTRARRLLRSLASVPKDELEELIEMRNATVHGRRGPAEARAA